MTLHPFSHGKMYSIVVAERAGSVLSLLGSIFIIVTFAALKGFNKPINRLIFLASFGNILANTATLFSTSVLQPGANGKPTPACRAQGFLIQAFIPSDALWAACMAWNVYITFFHRYTPQGLKTFELRYILIAYGMPLLIAVCYTIADSQVENPIFGPATIWCWVTRDYDWMRLAFFYGPVIFIIGVTFVLYVIVFVKFIRKNSRDLSAVGSSTLPLYNLGMSSNPNEFAEIQAITDINITSEQKANFEPTRINSSGDVALSFSSTSPLTTNAADQPGHEEPSQHTVISAGSHVPITPAQQASKNARTYLLTAALCWLVLLVVWVPSTINRIQGMVAPEKPNFGMNLAASIVLPLQGLGNAIIYGVASRHEIKSLLVRRQRQRQQLP